MKKRGVYRTCMLVVMSIWLVTCWPLYAAAAESSGEKAVNKEMKKEVDMPTLVGDLWQKMTQDDKIAFVWGFWTVVSIEEYLMVKYPQLKTENFAAKVSEASHKAPKNANEIVALVDAYYQANPNEVKKPVVAVLWDEMIKPNITTGVAGRPLNQ